MENKLKVLSAYLPYKLKLKTPYGFRPNGKESTGISRVAYLTGDLYADLENKTFEINEFKPILFPLEDLTKPITIGGKTFKVEDEIFAMCNVGLSSNAKKYWKENFIENIKNTPYTQLSYEVVQKLLEWKFNVFNLPEDEYVKVTDEFNPYK